MKYSIVIPTYNHCDDLLKPCIDSIIKYSDLSLIELIVISNGGKDETPEYLAYMQKWFAQRGGCLKYEIYDAPLGYAKSTNHGIRLATCDKIILLNNDVVLLDQPVNQWLDMLNQPFEESERCGLTGPVKVYSPHADDDFIIFFCVMIRRAVFDEIGLLNEEYGKGGGEDVEFSMLASRAGWTMEQCANKSAVREGLWGGGMPLYHKGEGTVHDTSLVPDWQDMFWRNNVRVARKFKNVKCYKEEFGGDQERYAIQSGVDVDPVPAGRYKWVGSRITGKKVLEIGCSNGYGTQFLPKTIDYLGIDKDEKCIAIAPDEKWGDNFKFEVGDIYTFPLGEYDTIIALNFVHLFEDGLTMVEYLQKHCKQLFVSVPFMNRSNTKHCKLFNLTASNFPGWNVQYLSSDGIFYINPTDETKYMVCEWNR